MKRILNYPGSKWRMSDLIIEIMPPHKTYLEPYFGSGAVFFNKDKVQVETINDLDGRLINMFRVLRENTNELVKLVHLTPYSRQEYDLSKRISDNNLEDARRMLVRCWFAIGGKTNADVGWRRNINWNGPYNTYEWNDMPNRLIEAAERLKGAQIENKSAIELIHEHRNDKDVMIYCDPPYLDETRVSKHYTNEMSNQDHIKLLKCLANVDGKVILSGYPNNLYDEYLSEWFKVTEETRIGINNTNKRTATEVLWCNFEPPTQINLFESVKGYE